MSSIYRSDCVYPWQRCLNLISLTATSNARLVDPEQEITVPSHVVAHVLPLEVIEESTLEDMPDPAVWYDIRDRLVVLRFDTPVLGSWRERLLNAEGAPTLRIYFVTLDAMEFRHRYSDEPETFPEFPLLSMLLDSLTDRLEPVYPLTLEFGPNGVTCPEFAFGAEIYTLVCANLENRHPAYTAMAGRGRFASTINVFAGTEEDVVIPAHPKFEEWNRRLYEFIGLPEAQTTRFLRLLERGRMMPQNAMVITGSAMAYAGYGGDITTYADADIDVFYRFKLLDHSHGPPKSNRNLRLAIDRLLQEMGWNPADLVEVGINRYTFQIPGGRRIDFYLSSAIGVLGHHVAPARMYRDSHGFHVSASAMVAYETGVMGDVRYVPNSSQSVESIREKYIRRGFRFGPVMSRVCPSSASSSVPE